MTIRKTGLLSAVILAGSALVPALAQTAPIVDWQSLALAERQELVQQQDNLTQANAQILMLQKQIETLQAAQAKAKAVPPAVKPH